MTDQQRLADAIRLMIIRRRVAQIREAQNSKERNGP